MRYRSALAALAVAGCAGSLPQYPVPPGATPTGFHADPISPDLALLEYRIARYLAQDERPFATICASAGQPVRPRQPVALPRETEGRLLARFAALSPLDRCTPSGRGYADSVSGAPAAVFDVHQLECPKSTDCTAWGGFGAEGPHGWSYYRLRWRDGEWRIRRECDLGIVVT